ncbi:MAG: family 20 glycosylhydrolase [Clostridia bacterium]|nr:family 20 glycosylhydrolase [Clostridia bacterium]
MNDLTLIPKPKKIEKNDGIFTVPLFSMIVILTGTPRGASVYADELSREFENAAGFSLPMTRGEAKLGDVSLSLDDIIPPSEYSIEINESGVTVTGGALNSLGWGVATLRQIVRQCGSRLPYLKINDAPVFENRGFYHDITRGRVDTLDELFRLADKLSFYKINQLQLYIEHTYLFRDISELWRDETPLTASEILALDDYCAARGIELVPSLSSFGHLYKLLSTVTYSELCELPDSDRHNHPFYFEERMAHHTINVSNESALPLIKKMISEYMALFRSDKFNICADETFDLGQGRSRELAERVGGDRLYVDYIKELFDFLIKRGKTPMFWGDIITRCPELISELPKEVICLNWGYSPVQNEYDAQVLSDAGASQYVCPGVAGWNMWINSMNTAYLNISRMTSHGKKYGAVGLLNTDWGDCGHVNQPVFSVPGLIYGAVGAWCGELPEYDELNREISILEFGDPSGKIVSYLGEASGLCALGWGYVVHIKGEVERGDDIKSYFDDFDPERARIYSERLIPIENEIRALSAGICGSRDIVGRAVLSIEIIRAWNDTGAYIKHMLYPDTAGEFDKRTGTRIAARLEGLLYRYGELWRRDGKEGDLRYITEIFAWYADIMRRCAMDRELDL